MTILVFTSNEHLLGRWKQILTEVYTTCEATSLSELRNQLMIKVPSLLILHRSQIDMGTALAIRRAVPKAGIFILADRPNDTDGIEFLKMGMVGYGNAYMSPNRLIEAVRVTLDGRVWVGQKLMQVLIRGLTSGSEIPQGTLQKSSLSSPNTVSLEALEKLTPRERQIAGLIAKGQSNLEIAADLGISERTVKAHLSAIYAKTETGSRLNLALLMNSGQQAYS